MIGYVYLIDCFDFLRLQFFNSIVIHDEKKQRYFSQSLSKQHFIIRFHIIKKDSCFILLE